MRAFLPARAAAGLALSRAQRARSSAGDRAGGSAEARAALTQLRTLLTDGYNGITAIPSLKITLARVRFYYCCASPDTDETPELARIDFQPRRSARTRRQPVPAPAQLNPRATSSNGGRLFF
jgi:hypothetical protein